LALQKPIHKCVNDILLLSLAQAGKNGQTYFPGVKILRHREITLLKTEPAPVIRLQMHGNIVYLNSYAMRLQVFKQSTPVNGRLRSTGYK
jgi:hypothetical protein